MVSKRQSAGTGNKAQAPKSSLAEAVYPNKQAWKKEPGNRYTPEELHEMDRNWNVHITNPDLPHFCPAD